MRQDRVESHHVDIGFLSEFRGTVLKTHGGKAALE